MEDFSAQAYEASPPDPSTLIPANSSLLYAMANWFESNIAQYHMPADLIVTTIFNSSSSKGVPLVYTAEYDSAEWSGQYLLAEACRYRVELQDGNMALAQQALANITKVLTGVDCIIHVAPNGGMARYAWPISNYVGGVSDDRYLGYWNGQYYIYEDDTSRDMFNGVLMGLGCTFLPSERHGDPHDGATTCAGHPRLLPRTGVAVYQSTG